MHLNICSMNTYVNISEYTNLKHVILLRLNKYEAQAHASSCLYLGTR